MRYKKYLYMILLLIYCHLNVGNTDACVKNISTKKVKTIAMHYLVGEKLNISNYNIVIKKKIYTSDILYKQLKSENEYYDDKYDYLDKAHLDGHHFYWVKINGKRVNEYKAYKDHWLYIDACDGEILVVSKFK